MPGGSFFGTEAALTRWRIWTTLRRWRITYFYRHVNPGAKYNEHDNESSRGGDGVEVTKSCGGYGNAYKITRVSTLRRRSYKHSNRLRLVSPCSSRWRASKMETRPRESQKNEKWIPAANVMNVAISNNKVNIATMNGEPRLFSICLIENNRKTSTRGDSM